MKVSSEKLNALFSAILLLAAEKLSDRVCDEVDKTLYKDWTKEEIEALELTFHRMNEGRHDPVDYYSGNCQMIQMSSIIWMAAKLIDISPIDTDV